MKTLNHLVASIEISWHDFRALHLAWAINYSFGKNATILFDQRKKQQQQEKQQQEQNFESLKKAKEEKFVGKNKEHSFCWKKLLLFGKKSLRCVF